MEPTVDDPSETTLSGRAVRRAMAPRRRNAEADVRRLLDVGLALMTSADGYDPPRVADIVRAAGLSNEAFYRYFASKDDLVAAVVEDGAARLVSHVRHQLGKSADPARQLRMAMEAVLKQAADPAVAATTRAVMRNAPAPRAAGTTGEPRLAGQIAALFEQPLHRLRSPDPQRDARALATTVLATMEHFLWSEDVPTEADTDHLIGFLLRGAHVTGAPRPEEPTGRGR